MMRVLGRTAAFMTVMMICVAGSRSQQVSAPAQNGTAVLAAVKIDNFSFEPQTLTVKAGTTVVWTNRDDIPHTVVSTDFVFKSKPLDTDDAFRFTLTKPGTYSYFCSMHPKMTGKVIVE